VAVVDLVEEAEAVLVLVLVLETVAVGPPDDDVTTRNYFLENASWDTPATRTIMRTTNFIYLFFFLGRCTVVSY
jgi:uncharacterized membrane protein YciS (DUF1049 family)